MVSRCIRRCNHGRALFLFNLQDKSDKINLIGQHDKGANSLSWRSDGTEFATAGHDGLVKVWDSSNVNAVLTEAGDSWVGKLLTALVAMF